MDSYGINIIKKNLAYQKSGLCKSRKISFRTFSKWSEGYGGGEVEASPNLFESGNHLCSQCEGFQERIAYHTRIHWEAYRKGIQQKGRLSKNVNSGAKQKWHPANAFKCCPTAPLRCQGCCAIYENLGCVQSAWGDDPNPQIMHFGGPPPHRIQVDLQPAFTKNHQDPALKLWPYLRYPLQT